MPSAASRSTDQLSEHIEALGARRQQDALPLARWRLAGGRSAPAEVWLAAARRARLAYDLELAVALADAAGAEGAGAPAEVLAAQSLLKLGRQDEAAGRLRSALASAVDPADVTAAAIELSVIQFWSMGDEAGALATVSSAMDRVDGGHRARLDAHLASFEAIANRPVDALRRVEAHLATGEGRSYLLAVLAAAPALGGVGRAADALELAERSIPMRLALTEDEDLLQPDIFKYLVSKVFALSELGPLDEAAAFADEVYALAAGARAVQGVAWAAMLVGRVALVAGHLDRARSALDEAVALFGDLEEHGLRAWNIAGQVLVAAMAGDAGTAAVDLAALEAVPANPVRAMAELDRAPAWAAWVAGDRDGAHRRIVQAIGSTDRQRRQRPRRSRSCTTSPASGSAGRPEHLHDGHRSVQGALAGARLAFIEALAADDGAGLEPWRPSPSPVGRPVVRRRSGGGGGGAHRGPAPADGPRPARRRPPGRGRLPGRPHAAAPRRALGRASPIGSGRSPAWPPRALQRRHRRPPGRSVRTVENHLQRAYDKLGVTNRSDLAAALTEP